MSDTNIFVVEKWRKQIEFSQEHWNIVEINDDEIVFPHEYDMNFEDDEMDIYDVEEKEDAWSDNGLDQIPLDFNLLTSLPANASSNNTNNPAPPIAGGTSQPQQPSTATPLTFNLPIPGRF